VGEVTLVFVILFRLLAPFTILRWPLLGGILCIVADASDVMLFEKFGKGPLTDSLYHNFDKFLDVYYLSFEAYVAYKWKDLLAKRAALALFILRLAGAVIFEISTVLGATFRPIFLLTPNIFENFFLFMILAWKFNPHFKLSLKRLIVILLVVGIPKLAQEYVMHFKYPDRTWHFLRDNIFFFLYK
jgi:hypothetical protein